MPKMCSNALPAPDQQLPWLHLYPAPSCGHPLVGHAGCRSTARSKRAFAPRLGSRCGAGGCACPFRADRILLRCNRAPGAVVERSTEFLHVLDCALEVARLSNARSIPA